MTGFVAQGRRRRQVNVQTSALTEQGDRTGLFTSTSHYSLFKNSYDTKEADLLVHIKPNL